MLHTHVFFLRLSQGDQQSKRSFNLFWLRVQMSYHKFNNLEVILNGDLTAKIGWGIFSNDSMNKNIIGIFHLKST